MSLKRLSDVSVGSKVKIDGVTYKLDSVVDGIPLFVQEVFPGAFASQKRGAGSLIAGYEGPEHHLVTVVEVGTGSQSDLTSQLRKQVAQKSLTDSLRAQVESSASEDDEDEDWDDEEEYEEEEEQGYSNYYTGPSRPHTHGHYDFGTPPQSLITAQAFSGVEEVKQSALTANLRAQDAQKGAQQAKLNAAIAKAKATGVQASVDFVATKVQNAQSELRELGFEVDSLAREHDELTDEVYSLSGRVHQIERKQKEEENKVSLQNELNKKLNLQAQLNQKLNQKTTGGNGTMKNLLGNAFNFGKVEGKFAFSPITGGLALRKGISNDYVAYNKDTKELTDVSGLTLKFDVPAFKLPVAGAQIAVGDLIIHNAEFVYVTKKADGYLETLNPEKGVRGSVVPTKNALLNATFYTVVKTLDAAGQGGFNPMLLMALNKGGDKKDLLPLLLATGGLGGNGAANGQIDPTMLMMLGDDVEDLLPLVLMQQGGATGAGFNPLMFLAMNKGGKSKDLLPLLAMTGGLGGATQGQAGGINPMMMMALAGDGDIDFTTLALMGGFNGQGGLFGQAPAATPVAPAQTEGTDAE